MISLRERERERERQRERQREIPDERGCLCHFGDSTRSQSMIKKERERVKER
jgi:hypothetical protein